MVEIIKTYRQSVPAMRFIGKRYGNEDRVAGGFGRRWDEWFSNGWFKELEQNCDIKKTYEDGDAYIGLMRCKDGEAFEYWIGVFCPEETKIPAGYSFIDFKEADFGVTWLYGKGEDLFGQELICARSCKDQGFEIKIDEQGALWEFERYKSQRFNTPDDKGNIILDICLFIEKL
jgi:predicted transcriptional regulator YdeE